MTQTTILLFTLGMLAGLPAGYWLAWAYNQAMQLLERALGSYVWLHLEGLR